MEVFGDIDKSSFMDVERPEGLDSGENGGRGKLEIMSRGIVGGN